MHTRLGGTPPAGTRRQRGPSVAVRGKPTVYTDRQTAPAAVRLPASPRNRKWGSVVGRLPFGACFTVLPCPDSCRFPASGGLGQGARSARSAAPQAPLTRPAGSGSWPAGARERTAVVRGFGAG